MFDLTSLLIIGGIAETYNHFHQKEVADKYYEQRDFFKLERDLKADLMEAQFEYLERYGSLNNPRVPMSMVTPDMTFEETQRLRKQLNEYAKVMFEQEYDNRFYEILCKRFPNKVKEFRVKEDMFGEWKGLYLFGAVERGSKLARVANSFREWDEREGDIIVYGSLEGKREFEKKYLNNF